MTGIRGGGGIMAGGAAGAGVVPPKIIADEMNKRKSLKGELLRGANRTRLIHVSLSCRDRELKCGPE